MVADCIHRAFAYILLLATSQLYSNLFFLLQAEPRHVASLCRMVNLSEIDTLLQTVMFTLYGNQYESREEHLLLTMFQVSLGCKIWNRDDRG
jgi:Ras GTPase-activating-like protein IQGAP2/3